MMASTWCSRSAAAPIRRTRCSCARPSAAADAPWTELIGDFDNQFSFIGNDGTKFYFLTDLDAPTKRIVAMDIDQPGREQLTEIVPAGKGDARCGQHPRAARFIAQYMVDVLSHVSTCSTWRASRSAKSKLPGNGTVDGFGGDQDDKETFLHVHQLQHAAERLSLRRD